MIGCDDILCSYVYGHSGGGGGGGGVPSGALAWRRVELWCVPTVQTASEPLFFVTTSRRCVLRYDTVVCCVMIRLCVELW